MSSRSQSSKRRSSSRRSSSSKRKGIKKTAAHEGANFWIMLGGFVSGATVLLLIISVFGKEAINQEIIEADDSNRAEVATQVQSKDFKTFVANGNVDQLVEILKSLQEVKTFDSNAKFLTNVQRQQMIVDSMMEKPLSDEHRRMAVMARLKGTADMFWTDQSKVVGDAELGLRLREISETHVANKNDEIRFEARIQLARLNAVEATESAVPFAKEIHQLLADFPTNKRVQKTITKSLNFLVLNPESRPATLRVLKQFFKLPKIAGDQSTENLYVLLRDLENLCELKYFDSYDNVQFTGEAGRDQLRDVCLDLAKIPTVGKEVIGNMTLAARWMESNNHYQHAIDIYKAVIESGKRLSNPKDVALAELQGHWGVKRCESIGKPFNLAATMYNGKPLNLTVFESMPVLIVFWSRSDDTEKILFKVESASRRWRRNAVKIIAVQVEKDEVNFDDELISKKKEQFPTWSFCYDYGTGKGPLFSQIPRVVNGRIALLDRQHKVFDVEVDLEELVTSVNSVLATRSPEK